MPGDFVQVDEFGGDDEAILDELAGCDEVGADGDFLFLDEFGGRRARKRRRARRRQRRRRILRGAYTGVKKVAKNKVVRAVSKAALTMVPGGQVVTAATTAARLGAKLASAAKRGSPSARGAYELAQAARAGDRRALDTLRAGATGRYGYLPLPPQVAQSMRARAASFQRFRRPSSRATRALFPRAPGRRGANVVRRVLRAAR